MKLADMLKKVFNSNLTENNKIKSLAYIVKECCKLKNEEFTIELLNDNIKKAGFREIKDELFSQFNKIKYPPVCLLKIFFNDKYEYKKCKYIYNNELAFYFNYLIKKNNTNNKLIGNDFLLNKKNNNINAECKEFDKLLLLLNKCKKESAREKEIKLEIKELLKSNNLSFVQKYNYTTKRKLNQEKISYMNTFLENNNLININRDHNKNKGKRTLNELKYADQKINSIADKLIEQKIKLFNKEEITSGWELKDFVKVFGKEEMEKYTILDVY